MVLVSYEFTSLSCSSVIGGKVKNLNIKKIPKLKVSGSYMV